MAEPYLTMAEIEAKYPNQWVLIDKPTVLTRNPTVVTGGVVVMHASDRTEFDRRFVELDEFSHVVECAILYLGRMPDEPTPDFVEWKHAQ
jgi:hypothetical protein